ncbi:MAG: hypothetical protein AAF915_07675 [Cyanobacteria bacterium P01_D01_bin.50]
MTYRLWSITQQHQFSHNQEWQQLSQNPGWCVTRKHYYCVNNQALCHSTLQENIINH